MRYTTKTVFWAVGLIIIAGLIGLFVSEVKTFKTQDIHTNTASNVLFTCKDNKLIKANFNDHSVNLQLSDGRNLTLRRATSGSGARYANDDGHIVFWNKGNTAFIKEKETMTYNSCVIKGQDDLVNLKMYDSRDIRFRYPRVLHIYKESADDTTGWSYESTQSGKVIVQLKLADSVQPKTNLSEATFTVGESNNKKAVADCMKLPQAAIIKPDSINKAGTMYLRSLYGEAGAGNFYQVRQFRALHQNKCYSIEEMVHSTNIHNYPPERGISEFDSARVWKALNVAWQTLNFTK